MSEKHLIAKIAKKTIELQEMRKENRYLRHRVQEVSSSRESWKSKYHSLQGNIGQKASCIGGKSTQSGDKKGVNRHKYSLKVITLSIMLYVFGGCSFRSVHKVLGCIHREYGLFGVDIPCKSSVENWVQKLGYSEYTRSGKDLYRGDYAVIIDESMVIGQQRMMVVLGVDAVKTEDKALCLGTVRVLSMSVKPSWNASQVCELLGKVGEKVFENYSMYLTV